MQVRGSLTRLGGVLDGLRASHAQRLSSLDVVGDVLDESVSVVAHLDQVIAESEDSGFCCLED